MKKMINQIVYVVSLKVGSKNYEKATILATCSSREKAWHVIERHVLIAYKVIEMQYGFNGIEKCEMDADSFAIEFFAKNIMDQSILCSYYYEIKPFILD